MDVMTGVVVDGKVVVEGATLPEGRKIALVLMDSDDDPVYTATPEEAADLQVSAEEGRKGKRIDAFEHLRQLRSGATE